MGIKLKDAVRTTEIEVPKTHQVNINKNTELEAKRSKNIEETKQEISEKSRLDNKQLEPYRSKAPKDENFVVHLSEVVEINEANISENNKNVLSNFTHDKFKLEMHNMIKIYFEKINKQGLNHKSDNNKIEENIQTIAIIDLVSVLKIKGELPRDIIVISIPNFYSDKGKECDLALFSKEMNLCIPIQLKGRNLEINKPFNIMNMVRWCESYKDTPLIFVMVDEDSIDEQLNLLNGVNFKGIEKLVFMSINKKQMFLNREELNIKLTNIVDEVAQNKEYIPLILNCLKNKPITINKNSQVSVKYDISVNDEINPIVAGMTIIASTEYIKDYVNCNKFEKIEKFNTKTGINLYVYKKTLENLKLNDTKPTFGNLLIKEFVIISKD
jgi:hypothetical protein